MEFRPQRPRGWRRLLYVTVYRVVRPRSPLSRRERAFSAPSRRHAPGRPGQNLRGTGNSRRRGQPRLLGGEPAPIPSWTGREGGAEPKRHPPRRRTPAPRAPPAAAGGSRLCAVPRTSHRRADRGGWGEIRRRFLRGREERVAQSPGSACIRGPSRGSSPGCASICRKCTTLVGSCAMDPPARLPRWRRTLFESLRTLQAPAAPGAEHGDSAKQTHGCRSVFEKSGGGGSRNPEESGVVPCLIVSRRWGEEGGREVWREFPIS